MEAARALPGLPKRPRSRDFAGECEQLRPLGVAFILHRYGHSLDHADAEDAVAEVVIRLHRHAEAGRRPDNLRAAFFTSCRNAAIDQLRSRNAKPTVALDVVAEAPTAEPVPEDRLESIDDRLRLREAIGRMRPNYREAIALRFGLGLTVPEIADRLAISLPAAKKLVLRATRQVRQRMESIESAEFCPEMRDIARRSLFDGEALGIADDTEGAVLRAHFEHCGSCRSFLADLHGRLHDLGGAAVLGGLTSRRIGLAQHLAGWAAQAAHGVHSGLVRARLVALKAGAAIQPDGAGTAGALAGTGQRIAAICTAGAATTATCLATGIVGPGLGLSASQVPPHHPLRPAHVHVATPNRPTVSTAAIEPTPAPSEASARVGSAQTRAARSAHSAHPGGAPSPAEQGESEFGFEGESPTPTPTAPAATASSIESPPPPSPSPGASSSGGTEQFGFGG